MKSRLSWLVAMLVIVVLVAALGAWWLRHQHAAPTVAEASPKPPAQNSVVEPVNPALQHPLVAPLDDKLLAMRNSLLAGRDTETVPHQLAGLRQALSSADPAVAATAIQRFLDLGADSTTGVPFQPGPKGTLSSAPSLRVFLLDLLAEIDPQAAIAYSRRILEAPGSADEWAIALRNVSRLDTASDARAFLEQKTAELFRQESWLNNPSTGFLEAFDVAVQLGGTGLLPPLTDLVQRQDNQAVAHAAFLALDRMVIREPAQILEVLEQHPEMMAGREQTRANYFARADVGDPAQRQLVERHLLNPARPVSEVQTFAGVFPNANYMISQNLLTENVTPDGATLVQRDRAALQVVGEWLADPRFAGLQPQLLQIQQRLAEFVRQAESNR